MKAVGEAPGKVILVGEHAVVYGRPAIAVPVWQVRATTVVTDAEPCRGCMIAAPDISELIELANAPANDPLALVVRLTLSELGIDSIPDWTITVTSDIPIASGMGSGAAVSASLVRALYAAVNAIPTAEIVSRLVYASEEIHHGAPSGIDNTVVSYGAPVWFVRGQPPEVFRASRSFTLVIADSGIASPTRDTVAGVRRRWEAAPDLYDRYFDAIGQLAQEARSAIESGENHRLGGLFNRNQALLQEIGVSSARLDELIDRALDAGADGAKLSGGGAGGNIIALVKEGTAEAVGDALMRAGAKQVIVTGVGAH